MTPDQKEEWAADAENDRLAEFYDGSEEEVEEDD